MQNTKEIIISKFGAKWTGSQKTILKAIADPEIKQNIQSNIHNNQYDSILSYISESEDDITINVAKAALETLSVVTEFPHVPDSLLRNPQIISSFMSGWENRAHFHSNNMTSSRDSKDSEFAKSKMLSVFKSIEQSDENSTYFLKILHLAFQKKFLYSLGEAKTELPQWTKTGIFDCFSFKENTYLGKNNVESAIFIMKNNPEAFETLDVSERKNIKVIKAAIKSAAQHMKDHPIDMLSNRHPTEKQEKCSEILRKIPEDCSDSTLNKAVQFALDEDYFYNFNDNNCNIYMISEEFIKRLNLDLAKKFTKLLAQEDYSLKFFLENLAPEILEKLTRLDLNAKTALGLNHQIQQLTELSSDTINKQNLLLNDLKKNLFGEDAYDILDPEHDF